MRPRVRLRAFAIAAARLERAFPLPPLTAPLRALTRPAACFYYVGGMALAPTGVIYTTELYQYCIRAITMTGVSRAIAGECTGNNNRRFRDGYGTNAMFYQPRGIAVIPPDDTKASSLTWLLVADTANWRIVQITVPNDGISPSLTTTVLGPAPVSGVGKNALPAPPCCESQDIACCPRTLDLPGAETGFSRDGVGANVRFVRPRSIAVHPTENVAFIADGASIRAVDMNTWAVVTLVGGNVTGSVFSDSPTVGTNAAFNGPSGLAYFGNVFVADSNNNRIRVVSFPTGTNALDAPVPVATNIIPACDSTWHHVALVYTPSAKLWQLAAFVDGAYVLQQAVTIALPVSAVASSLRIGWSGDLTTNGGSLFAGTLNDLRIYSRALTLDEVVDISQPELTQYWVSPHARAPTASPPARASDRPPARLPAHLPPCARRYAHPRIMKGPTKQTCVGATDARALACAKLPLTFSPRPNHRTT